MEVSEYRDERLNFFTETRAAHRYLRSNNELFNDWLLGIFAYNVGENAVERGIKKYGTRDVWELGKYIRGDKNYMDTPCLIVGSLFWECTSHGPFTAVSM